MIYNRLFLAKMFADEKQEKQHSKQAQLIKQNPRQAKKELATK
jgi:hypothetical protein